MSEKVKVRVVVEEILRYDQVIEMTQEDFDVLDVDLEEGVPDTATQIRDTLDLNAVICLDCEVQRFEIVGEEET